MEVSIYITSYNSPKQLKFFMYSIKEYDENFIKKCNLYLINNTTDSKFDNEYQNIISEYGITEYKFNNIGIMGARIFAARHFNESNSDYYIYFEDDMTFSKDGTCSNGLNRFTNNLFNKILNIIKQNNYDFLKLNFTEVILSNEYNYPESLIKSRIVISKRKLVKTKFNNIHFYNGLAYLDGEIYISNWPVIISKEGNRSIYINRKVDNILEHDLSISVQADIKSGLIKSAVLLLSPIHHNRVYEYYTERKEY